MFCCWSATVSEEAWPALNDRLLSVPARPDRAEIQRRIVVLARDKPVEAPGTGRPRRDRRPRAGRRLCRQPCGAAGAGQKALPCDAVGPGAVFMLDATAASVARGRSSASPSGQPLASIRSRSKWSTASCGISTRTPASRPCPWRPADNGAGVLAVCGWMTGFPMRTGFGSRRARRTTPGGQTPTPGESGRGRLRGLDLRVRRAAARLGCAILSSIALCDSAARPARTPKVLIEVGRPGVDHDAVVAFLDTGTLVAVGAFVIARASFRASPRRSPASPGAFQTRAPRHADPHQGRTHRRPRAQARRSRRPLVRGERIVAPPDGARPTRRSTRAASIVDGGRHRHPLAYRRRQREHRAPAAARTASRACAPPRRHRSPTRAGRPSRPAASTRRWVSQRSSSPPFRRIMRCTRI